MTRVSDDVVTLCFFSPMCMFSCESDGEREGGRRDEVRSLVLYFLSCEFSSFVSQDNDV